MARLRLFHWRGGQIRLINYAFDPYWKLLLILGFAASTRIVSYAKPWLSKSKRVFLWHPYNRLISVLSPKLRSTLRKNPKTLKFQSSSSIIYAFMVDHFKKKVSSSTWRPIQQIPIQYFGAGLVVVTNSFSIRLWSKLL